MRLIPTYKWGKNVRAVRLSNKNFRDKPWAAGGILILCVIIAMLLANLPFTHQFYHDVLNTSLSMSIFVDTLSFGDYPDLVEHLRASGKIAVLLGSLSAGILGSLLIQVGHKLKPNTQAA